ncbi:NmrA-like family domain-containing protein 1 [Ceratobasidium sp. AG-Ba]|nr:NmrA-like family domain-containing protein 1 [Ceratobasidium sp. AG-Ba]
MQSFKSRGAVLCPVSYDNHASLVNALQGVEVLLSAVAINAILAQLPLVKAAKEANVSVFFPSEYGGRCENNDSRLQMFRDKQKVIDAAKDAGLPIAGLATGPWPEYAISPPMGFDFANKKVTIWGNPDTKITFTTLSSIAQWVAHVLKDVPVTELQNKYLNIQGDLVSRNDIIRLWERKHKAKLEVEFRPVKELEERIEADPTDYLASVLAGWDTGEYHLQPIHNDLYPDWKPDSVESLL